MMLIPCLLCKKKVKQKVIFLSGPALTNLDNLDKKINQFDLTNPGIGLNY